MLIKRQLRLGFLLTLLVLLAAGTVLVLAYRDARHAENKRNWASQLVRAVFECNVFALEFATQNSERAHEQYDISSARLSRLLAAPPADLARNFPRLTETREQKTRMDALVGRIAASERSTAGENRQLETEFMNMLASQTVLHAQAILNAALQFRSDAYRQSTRASNVVLLCAVGMIVILLAGAGGMLAFYYKRVLVPLEQLADAARKLGAGDLSTQVTTSHEDELGTVASNFNVMAAQLQRREAELRQRIKDMNTLCYSIAHDLKAPLRAIAGLSKILQDDYASQLGDEGQGYIRRMQMGAERMDALIEGLLEYGTISHRELPLRPVDLENVWREVLMDGIQAEADRRGAVLRKEGVLPLAQGNVFVLRTALTNLVSNALKYGPVEGTTVVTIRAETSAGKVLLSVKDNGIGIAPDHQGRIFGLFERLNMRPEIQGTGLGLAIAKRGIERLGGTLKVFSEPGKGSTFTIEVPAATEPPTRSTHRATQPRQTACDGTHGASSTAVAAT